MGRIVSQEEEIPNPGGKLCRVCKGPIHNPTLIRYGKYYRHKTCTRNANRLRSPGRIKVVGKSNTGRWFGYMNEATDLP